jgi:hypothetical protein
MARTRFRIEQHGIEDPIVMIKVYEPSSVPHAGVNQTINCDINGTPFGDLAALSPDDLNDASTPVKDAGIEMLNRLKVHGGVQAALDLVDGAPPEEPCPVYFEMSTELAEEMPFETLFLSKRKFLALDERTPIVRVVGTRESQDNPINLLCNPPLRATIVISAAERPTYEDTEWDALYKAFQNSGIDFQLQVLVGRKTLRDKIEQSGDQRITVHLLDDGLAKELTIVINEFEPAVLHFFCHGKTDLIPYLEIGKSATHDLGEDPLYLAQNDIRSLAASAWIVVLNACEGAGAVKDNFSLAQAVALDGVPAVVGMRESINAVDANLFTEAFYPELLSEFDKVFSSPEDIAPDWSRLMKAPRERIIRKNSGPPLSVAQRDKGWSLPVLYQRPEKMSITRTGGSVDDQQKRLELFGELKALLEFKESRAGKTPLGMQAEIDQRIAELMKLLSG